MIPLHDTIKSRGFPIINWLIIALNGLVFLYELSLRPIELNRLFLNYGMVPASLHLSNPFTLLNNPAPLITLVTGAFLHQGWFHFLSNMWVLYIFGDNVEDRMGSTRYVLFYLFSGVIANLLQAFVFPASRIPAIGASGAIAGVLGAYFLFYPSSKITTLIPIFFIPWILEVPAIVFLGFWFVSQIYSGLFSLSSAASSGGVAWWAHIGGFLFGVIFSRLFTRPPTYDDFQYPTINPP